MLLYERGNVDLIVFFVCALIVLSEGYSANLAALLIAVGTIIKLFPFFGVTVLLSTAKNRFWMLLGSCFLILVVYMLLTSSSVNAAWNLTPRGFNTSYGTNVFANAYAPIIADALAPRYSSSMIALLLKYGPLTVGLFLAAITCISAFRTMKQTEVLMGTNLAAFRMGASVYVGTFLLGNNWDYRLAFLVLVVPQLFEWIRSSNGKIRSVARNCQIVLYLSCWHFIAWFSPFISSNPERLSAVFIFDELANWVLMLGLTYLLAASVPLWVMEQATSRMPKWGWMPTAHT
jgi:hypothetical protein